MKKIMIVIAVVVLFAPSIIFAEGIANTFEIDYVRVSSDGRGFVNFTSNLVNTPASCIGSGYEKALSFDLSTAAGKAIYSLVLAAKVSGKRIYAKGSGTCTVYSTVEDWSWGKIVD